MKMYGKCYKCDHHLYIFLLQYDNFTNPSGTFHFENYNTTTLLKPMSPLHWVWLQVTLTHSNKLLASLSDILECFHSLTHIQNQWI